MKILPLLLLPGFVVTTALSQSADQAARKQGSFGIGVKGGPAIPVGEFANLFQTGFTGFVEVPYNFTPEFQLYMGLGYSRFEVDNAGLSKQLEDDYGSATTNLEAPYQVIPLVLGINVAYRYPHFWPYFTLSVGAYYQTLKTSGSYTINGVTTVASKSQSWVQGAYSVGLGTLIPLGDEGWAIDVNAKFNAVIDYEGRVLVTTPDGDDVSTRAIRYASVLAGLSYTFH
jgi:hypothetical protein